MAIGASGVAEFTTTANWTNYTLRVYWQQEYTAGGTTSTVNITKCTLQSSVTKAGSFFMSGIIKINDTAAITCWFENASSHPAVAINTTNEITLTGLTGSVTVNQSGGAAVNTTISIASNQYSGFRFWNSSYGDMSFSIPANDTNKKSISLNAIQLGCAYIGNDRYVPYICVDGVYAQYEPYIGAADGSAWILQGG